MADLKLVIDKLSISNIDNEIKNYSQSYELKIALDPSFPQEKIDEIVNIDLSTMDNYCFSVNDKEIVSGSSFDSIKHVVDEENNNYLVINHSFKNV